MRRSKRWEAMIGRSKTVNSLKRNSKLERFVRKGIPMKYRADVWMIVSGASKKREQEPTLYQDLCTKRVKPTSVIIEQVRPLRKVAKPGWKSIFSQNLFRSRQTSQERSRPTSSSRRVKTQKASSSLYSTSFWPSPTTTRGSGTARASTTSPDCFS